MKTIKHQQGTATLITAVIALLIMTVSAFLVNRVTIVDILNSNNQMQSSRAMEVAEAGINFVLAELNDDTQKTKYFCGAYIRANTTACSTPSSANASNVYTINDTALSDSGYSYNIQITRPSPTGPISIVSTAGKTGCVTGLTCTKKTVNVLLANDPLFKKMPPDAVSTPGNVALTGSICVQNSSGNGGFAARAGLGLTTTNNLQGSGCAASNGNGLFGAISTVDTSLSAMNGTMRVPMIYSSATGYTSAQESTYFEYLFGQPDSYIFEKADTRIGGSYATSTASLSSFGNSGTDCSKSCGKIIWVEDATKFDLGNATYGTKENPVIIILNGTGVINGSPTINGMLYTSGSLQVNGNPTINGAVSIGGAGATGNGNLTVLYDADSLNNSLTVGAGFTLQSGSWRDWQ